MKKNQSIFFMFKKFFLKNLNYFVIAFLSFATIYSYRFQIMKVSRNFFKSNLSFLYFNYNNNRFDNSKFKIDISENTNFNRIFKSEEISSELHLIQKDIINANEYLIHHQEDTENLGVAGGYIDFISLNKIIGVNGIGELFLFDTTNYEFKKINSNLVNIYKSQNYKGKIIPQLRGKFSVRDI